MEAVLYWDRLRTITPGRGGDYSSFDAGQELRLLQQAGIYEPVHLEQGLTDNVRQSVISEMQKVIGGVDLDAHRPSDQLDRYSRVWQGKFPHIIEGELRDRGVLVQDDRQPGALRGHPALLQTLLTVAAVHIAASIESRSAQGRIVPCTSDDFAHATITAVLPEDRSKVTKSWRVDVSGLLPLPAETTSIEALLGFRADHRDEREACVRALHDLQTELHALDSNPRELLMAAELRTREAVDSLRFGMLDRFASLAQRTVLLTVAVGAAAAGGLSDAPALLDATGDVAGAVLGAWAILPMRKRDKRFSYVYQLERRLGPTRLAGLG